MTQPKILVIDFADLEARTSQAFALAVKSSISELILIGASFEDTDNFYTVFVSTYGFSFVFRYGKQYRSILINELDSRHVKILHELRGDIQ